jgi:hypothetical protein
MEGWIKGEENLGGCVRKVISPIRVMIEASVILLVVNPLVQCYINKGSHRCMLSNDCRTTGLPTKS